MTLARELGWQNSCSKHQLQVWMWPGKFYHCAENIRRKASLDRRLNPAQTHWDYDLRWDFNRYINQKIVTHLLQVRKAGKLQMYLQVGKCKRLYFQLQGTPFWGEGEKKSSRSEDIQMQTLQWAQVHPQKWFAAEQHSVFTMVKPSAL